MKYRLFTGTALAVVLLSSTSAWANDAAGESNGIKTGNSITVSYEQVASNGATILNTGVISMGRIHGTGIPVSISATGAVASNSITNVNMALASGRNSISVDSQSAWNSGAVLNSGKVTMYGGIKGTANSVTISATGAAAANSITNVKSGAAANSISVAGQTAENHGDVTNARMQKHAPAQIKVYGGIKGSGNSVTVSATGAAAANSVTNVAAGSLSNTIDVKHQSASNDGDILNKGSISLGKISGDVNSVSVSATGAVAANSITSVDVRTAGASSITAGCQTARNYASVTNTGRVQAGSLSGAGSSITISALGAGAVNSISNVSGRAR
jgi:hypothetical protein